MRRQLKAFIIDLDGVITDTAEYHYQAWNRLAEEEGIPFSREENEALRGVSRRESLLRLLKKEQVSEDKLQEMMDRKNRYYVEFIQRIQGDDILPGAMEMLLEIRKEGLLLGLASASKNAKTVLNNLSIADLFHTISDGYSVEKTKPDPQLFLHTAENLGAPPFCCAVVEDAESGIEGALRAEMLAIGIGPVERVGKAHYRYESVAQFNLQEILQGGS